MAHDAHAVATSILDSAGAPGRPVVHLALQNPFYFVHEMLRRMSHEPGGPGVDIGS